MLANMASSLIKNKRITTTVAKAKALRKYVEPLITRAKEDTTHSRRVVFSYLSDKEAVTTLYRDVIQKVGDRPGGYTRILKTGTRLGDGAEMCLIELVDFNENMLKGKGEVKAKTTRRSRKPAAKKSTPEAAAESTEKKHEAEEHKSGTSKQEASEKKPAAKAPRKKAEKAEETVKPAETEEPADEQTPQSQE